LASTLAVDGRSLKSALAESWRRTRGWAGWIFLATVLAALAEKLARYAIDRGSVALALPGAPLLGYVLGVAASTPFTVALLVAMTSDLRGAILEHDPGAIGAAS
jgi:hypothetical protein